MKYLSENLDVPFGDVYNRFNTHLRLPHNKHLIFSGAYGIGKTTFLNEYFKTNEKDFLLIRISPVHYSINSNQEIFELIKADILRQLFSKGELKFESKEKLDKLIVGYNFVRKQPLFLAKTISKAFSKLNPAVAISEGILSSSYEIIEKFKEYENHINSDYNQGRTEAEDYLESIESKFGSYIEYNIITQLIVNQLLEVKKKKGKRKGRLPVLLLDDLDRLDPEHIFRILNVFASHNDLDTTENKFGFEKVIISCDFKNITNLFHHNYGIETDFNGYMEKFYSDEIFPFSNLDGLELFFDNEFKSSLSPAANTCLKEILKFLIQSNRLQLRELMKFKNLIIDNEDRVIQSIQISHRIHSFAYINSGYHLKRGGELEKMRFILTLKNFEFLSILKYLISISGGVDQLLQKLIIQHRGKKITERDVINSFVKIFGLADLYQKSIQQSAELLFIKSLGDSLNEGPRNKNADLNPPDIFFQNNTASLILKWQAGEGKLKYEGGEDFFNEYNIRILDSKALSWTDLISFIQNFIQTNLNSALKKTLSVAS